MPFEKLGPVWTLGFQKLPILYHLPDRKCRLDSRINYILERDLQDLRILSAFARSKPQKTIRIHERNNAKRPVFQGSYHSGIARNGGHVDPEYRGAVFFRTDQFGPAR